ncbi:MAG: helix-turn-helix transcriptional regulator [Clostridiales bacterium]|nr:helix-turn-helix transcriptional regulator [Clostridiales bacterium]
MKAKEAVIKRISNLCAENDIAINELANRSGITPSTLYSAMLPERKDLNVSTVAKICDGLEISIRTFFDDDIFNNLEQEIK